MAGKKRSQVVGGRDRQGIKCTRRSVSCQYVSMSVYQLTVCSFVVLLRCIVSLESLCEFMCEFMSYIFLIGDCVVRVLYVLCVVCA